MKVCKHCLRTLAFTEFYRHKQMSDGHLSFCRLCVKDRTREYAAKNANRKKAYYADRFQRIKHDPEFRKARLARERKRRAANPQTEEQRLKLNAYRREKYKRDPMKYIIQGHRRRTLGCRASGSFTSDDFERICEAQGYKCYDCKASCVRLTVGHAIPLYRGGSNNPDNLIAQCKSCNSKQGIKIHPTRVFKYGADVITIIQNLHKTLERLSSDHTRP